MGAICLTESDERVRPRAALKSASDERPKPPNTSLHFRMQCRKKCIAQCSSRWKGCSSALEFRCPDMCAEVRFSPQCGTGRVDRRGQCWAGASFHWWPCWAAVCRIGRRASSVPTSSRSATGSSSGRVDDGRHHCFIVPCVPCPSSDLFI